MARIVRRVSATGVPERHAALDASFLLARAALLTACGQVSEASALLDGSALLTDARGGLIARQRDIILAGIDIALGRPGRALRVLQATDPIVNDHFAIHRAAAYLAQGELAEARQSVRSVLTSTNSGLMRCDVVAALLCEARICLKEQDEARSVELLVRATEIGGGDIVLPFAAVADVFAPILRHHPELAARWPTPPRAEPTILAAEARPPLIDPLTDRERAVLRYLVTSMSTAEIAAELFVSVNTVKTHLAAIYRKLAAGRRREAVLRARELELL
jgi:LuxR family maltose regulon positive regulatory protein